MQLDAIIKNIWYDCCGMSHISTYHRNDGKRFANNCTIKYNPKKQSKEEEYSNETELFHLLKKENDYIENDYDAVLTTKSKITLINIIKCNKLNKEPKLFLVNILGQNLKPEYNCATCKENKENKDHKKFYCIKCKGKICESCIEKHTCLPKNKYLEITNNPRTGIHCQELKFYKIGNLALSSYNLFQKQKKYKN